MSMSGEAKILDASGAQMATRRHFEAQYGLNAIADMKFSKCWYTPGPMREVWEVEGHAVIKKGCLAAFFGSGTEQRHFKYQIDAVSGNVIGFEQSK